MQLIPMNQMPMAMYGVLFWWYSIPMAMIPIEPMPIPYPCSRYHEPDTHAHDTDTMSGILDAHAVDADAICGILWRCPTCNYCNLLHRGSCRNQIPMAMMPIEQMPMPCVVSFGGDRHLCSRYHEPDAHGHDADAMCGVYSADTMNQMPMAMIPISMQLIPMPCVVSIQPTP